MSFYSASFKTLLTGAVNGVNTLPFPLTDDAYNITTPTPLAVPTATANTQALLVATGLESTLGESYGGSVAVTYNRLDLGTLFKGIDITWLTTSTDTKDFATFVANELGIPMVANDLVSTVLSKTDNNSYVEIKAAGNSPWFVGSCLVYYTRGIPDIATLIPEDWVSNAYKDLPTVDTNYIQSYNTDYTGSGAILRASVNPTTASARTLAWQTLFGGRPIQWVSGYTGVLYTGSVAVQAAGGKVGFNNLLIVPRLNAWAHFND